jgi:mono/diheme cytochrome c family protein
MPKGGLVVNFRSIIWIAALLAAVAAIPASAQRGEADYKSKCAMCHGADGLAESPAGKAMKTPSFKSPEMVKASDKELIDETKNGKGKMPAYKDKLTDAQIKDVVAYIRTLQK